MNSINSLFFRRDLLFQVTMNLFLLKTDRKQMNNIPFKYSIIFTSMKSIDLNYHIPWSLNCPLLEKETKHYYQDSKGKIAHNEKRTIQLLCLPVIITNCLMAITVDIIKMTLHKPLQDCKPSFSHSTAKLLSARAYSKDSNHSMMTLFKLFESL